MGEEGKSSLDMEISERESQLASLKSRGHYTTGKLLDSIRK
jgi:hypothetical protein